MRLFLSNVGNRDLAMSLDGLNVYFEKNGSFWPEIERKLGIERPGTRLAARRIRERIWEYEKLVSFPILSPAIEMMLQKVNRIERVVLFVTDNEEKDYNWAWDSIETARLFEEILKKSGRSPFFDKIDIVRVSQPHLYDCSYTQIGEYLESTFRRNRLKQVFVAVSGGIPAMNSALRSQAVDRFGARSVMIQVVEPTEEDKLSGVTGSAVAVDTWPFRRAAIIRVLELLLTNYDYEAAQVLLGNEGVGGSVKRLCQLGNAKFNLDHESVAILLGELGADAPNLPSGSPDVSQLDDLALSCHVLLRRRDLIGLLARISSLYELTERLIGRKLAIEPKVLRFVLKKKISSPEAAAQLPGLPRVLTELGKLDRLHQLRNDALHLGQGIGAADLNRAFPDFSTRFRDYLDNLVRILHEVFGPGADHENAAYFFDELNRQILSKI